MNSGNRIGELVPLLEKFEFPYCDMRHENAVRDKKGDAVPDQHGLKALIDQCPVRTRFKRPACNHCEGHSLDPLLEMTYVLSLAKKLTPELQSMETQHKKDLESKKVIDRRANEARTGETLRAVDVPSVADAEMQAAEFVRQHRAIVDRMRAFTIALLIAAKTST